jgi:hypothetical protein
MYDLYTKYWGKCDSIYQLTGGVKLNCAFAYVSKRESKYGSWGHLESLDQLDSLDRIKEIAPKYAALLDMNSERVVAAQPQPVPVSRTYSGGFESRIYTVHGHLQLRLQLREAARISAKLFDASGRLLQQVPLGRYRGGMHTLNLDDGVHAGGVYFVRVRAEGGTGNGVKLHKVVMP